MGQSVNRVSIGLVVMLIAVVLLTYAILGSGEAARQSVGGSRLQRPQDHKGKSLKLVHTVFRHGPRTPADTYPNDPYFDADFAPYGWGHLTNDGKKSLYELGQWLRQRYGAFLGKDYKPDYIYAQTTGVDRTQMSMQTVLAGLWPPKDTPLQFNRGLNWQPIPVWSQPLDQDTLLLVRTSCPRYGEALEEVFATPELRGVQDENQELYKKLTEITGLKISTPDDVQSLYSTLRAESEYGLKLPAWTKEFFPDKLLPLTECSYIYNVMTPELQRIKGGPFITKMVNEWKQCAEGTLKPKDRKMFMYTGHDSSMVNIAQALQVWEKQLPVYAIMLLVELYQDDTTKEFGVEFYLKNSTRGATPLTLPGCKFHCPLPQAIELTKDMIVNDLSEVCQAKDPNYTEAPPGGP